MLYEAKKLGGEKEPDAMVREDPEPGTMGRGGWREDDPSPMEKRPTRPRSSPATRKPASLTGRAGFADGFSWEAGASGAGLGLGRGGSGAGGGDS
jgi:hypothetical protein